MKMTHISPYCCVFESSLYRTNATVIDLGKSVIIVDPTWLPIEVDEIHAYVQQNHTNKKQYLLFTHSDYDHIIGYKKFQTATVIASEKLSNFPNKQKVIQQIRDFDDAYYISRSYPVAFPTIDIVIRHDFQQVWIDDVSLIFFLSPGHTEDGIFVVLPQHNIWIAGDYLSNIEMPIIDDELDSYKNTLSKAQNILNSYPDVHNLIPGHGDIARSRDAIQHRIADDKTYLLLLEHTATECPPNIYNDLLTHIQKYGSNPFLLAEHEKNITKCRS